MYVNVLYIVINSYVLLWRGSIKNYYCHTPFSPFQVLSVCKFISDGRERIRRKEQRMKLWKSQGCETVLTNLKSGNKSHFCHPSYFCPCHVGQLLLLLLTARLMHPWDGCKISGMYNGLNDYRNLILRLLIGRAKDMAMLMLCHECHARSVAETAITGPLPLCTSQSLAYRFFRFQESIKEKLANSSMWMFLRGKEANQKPSLDRVCVSGATHRLLQI